MKGGEEGVEGRREGRRVVIKPPISPPSTNSSGRGPRSVADEKFGELCKNASKISLNYFFISVKNERRGKSANEYTYIYINNEEPPQLCFL